jgi:hypothetical protein
MTTLHTEGMTDAQESEAKSILEVLTFAYSGHPWSVRVYDGGFFIRHLDFPGTWGMNHRSQSQTYSSSAMKRQIIRMAGEWLERADLVRGRSDDTVAKFVEGVPLKDQPGQKMPENMEVVFATPESERTEPRPQVKDMI